MLLNLEPVSWSNFHDAVQILTDKCLKHNWSQYSTLKSDPWVNFQPGSKFFITLAPWIFSTIFNILAEVKWFLCFHPVSFFFKPYNQGDLCTEAYLILVTKKQRIVLVWGLWCIQKKSFINFFGFNWCIIGGKMTFSWMCVVYCQTRF